MRSFVGGVALTLAVAGCAGLGRDVREPPQSRLLTTADSIDLVWLDARLFSLDARDGGSRATLQRVDPDTGEATVVAWPQAPCAQADYDAISSGEQKIFVARTCNPLSRERLLDYIVYDVTAGSWSTLVPTPWLDPVHGVLAWDDRAQEGLFTNLSRSCSSVFRLTTSGPSFIDQVLPTSEGDVDTAAGLTAEPVDGDCLRDGRIYSAVLNERRQVAMLVSPVQGPPGPAREGAEVALVVAEWTPGAREPFSDVKTVVAGLRFTGPAAWSADGTSVFWSDDEGVHRVDVESQERTTVSTEDAAQVVPSPDGSRLALRHVVEVDDPQIGMLNVEIRLLDLSPGVSEAS